MKYLKITDPKNEHGEQRHRIIPLLDFDKRHYESHSPIFDVSSKNVLRQRIAILRKHAQLNAARSIDGLELVVMRSEDGKRYLLMTNSLYWKTRASYYYGIIVGVERMRRSLRKRKKQLTQGKMQ